MDSAEILTPSLPVLPERYALADKIEEIHEEWEKRPHPRTSFGDYVSPRILEWIREGQNR